MTKIDAAKTALATHDVLRAANETEPRLNTDGLPLNQHAWVRWHTNVYQPAYDAWDTAMDELDVALGQSVSRHPMNFRPLCEEIATMREP